MTDPTISIAGTDKIVISHATKVIRRRTVLDDVSLELPRGGIYGFSGINGSGKTMLFRAIAGLIHLTSGTIDVFGQRIGRDASFPAGLGLILESVGFWEEYTGLDNLRLLASIRGAIGEREIRAALERVGLNPDDEREYGAYSLGMKQRLAVAQAVMEAPGHRARLPHHPRGARARRHGAPGLPQRARPRGALRAALPHGGRANRA